ncbi:MAG: hypothetical protein Sylvanvirus9_33, partial [Sylvanvirus sp.]
RGQLADVEAPYLPRVFKSFHMVNFFYAPNFDLIRDMEQIYLQAIMDPSALQTMPPLRLYISYLKQCQFFETFRSMFSMSSSLDYQGVVNESAAAFLKCMPNWHSFIDRVLLAPSLKSIFLPELQSCCIQR